jgi:hypothetical protein
MPGSPSELEFGLRVAAAVRENRTGRTSIDAALLRMLRINRVGVNGTRAVVWWWVPCVLVRVDTGRDRQAAAMTRAIVEA